MPDTPSIVIAKTMTYRGTPEIWTNKYHFEGTTPSSTAEWRALALAIWDSERPGLGSVVSLSGAVGYAAGNEAAVYFEAQAQMRGTNITGGSGAAAAGYPPGDASLWVRWATPDRNSKNKPIYLRKYFHGVPQNDATGDAPLAASRAAFVTHGTKMTDGTLPGGVKICGPQGADGGASAVAQYFTTRTLKRNARTPV